MIPILRDYQIKDVDRIRTEFRGGARGVIYQAPTGSGKTVVFADIARSVVQKNNRVWIIVHRQELVDQCSRALTILGVPHGIVAGGRVAVMNHPVLICSVQSLVRRLDKVGPVDLMIIDEAHHSVAGSWAKIIDARPNARILGVTATPERLDGRGLGKKSGGCFDVLIAGPSIQELVAAGHLAKTIEYIPQQIADLANMKIVGGDFAVGDAAARMDKPTVTGDAIDQYEKHCPGVPAIVFCTRIQHAENVAAAFRARGWRSESIDGKLPDAARRARIQGLGNGGIQVLTSCEIVNEGTDIPVVTAAILLRPTKSLGLYLQQVGRIMRPAPGKANAIILDHVGNCMRHGWADDEREWSLDGRPKAKATDAKIGMRICPKCFAAFRPAPVCPYCQTEYPISEIELEQIEGDLVQADKNIKLRFQRDRKREIGRARTMQDLESLAVERGYEPGWAKHFMANRAKAAARYRGRI